MMYTRAWEANDPPNAHLGYFSTIVKPILLIKQGYKMHHLPGHCPGRPRPAGTYGYNLYNNVQVLIIVQSENAWSYPHTFHGLCSSPVILTTL